MYRLLPRVVEGYIFIVKLDCVDSQVTLVSRTLGPFNFFLSLLKLERLRNGRGLQCSRRTRRHGGPDPGASDGEPAFAAGGGGARTASTGARATGADGEITAVQGNGRGEFRGLVLRSTLGDG